MGFKKELKATLIIIVLIALSVVVYSSMGYAIKYLTKISGVSWLLYLLGYIVGSFLFGWLERKFQNKFTNTLNLIYSLPMAIPLFFLQLAIPSVGLVMNIFLYFAVSFAIPTLLTRTIDIFEIYDIKQSTNVFIIITTGICISITLYESILSFVYTHSPFRIKNSKKMKRFKLDETIEYVISKENIRFIIYTAFFLYLVIFSFKFLQDSKVFELEGYDKAIYQSFLCYLALDRLLLNFKNFELKPSVLLDKIVKSMFSSNDEKKE